MFHAVSEMLLTVTLPVGASCVTVNLPPSLTGEGPPVFVAPPGRACIRLTVSPELEGDDDRLGAPLAMILASEDPHLELPSLALEHSGPFQQFIRTGRYVAGSASFVSEAECYKAVAGCMYVPGLLRDIQDSIFAAVMANGVGHISQVHSLLAGYDTITGMCYALEHILHLPRISVAQLRVSLSAVGSLFIFHNDQDMTVVFDLNHRAEDGVGGMEVEHLSHRHFLSETGVVCSNPSSQRFVSYTGTRTLTVAPGVDRGDVGHGNGRISDIEVLMCHMCAFARDGMRQVGNDGTDVPLFPSLYTLNAVITLPVHGQSELLYSRNDLWTYAFNEHVEPNSAVGRDPPAMP